MKWGRWEEIRELGAGGQARTYLVRDTDKVNPGDAGVNFANAVEQLRQAIPALGGGMADDAVRRHALAALEAIETYLSRDLGSNVAVLKLLHEPARSDAKALRRLEREVEVLLSCTHPNLLSILDANASDGWFVAPYHRGGTLADNLSSYAGNPETALQALTPLVDAVAVLHAKGVVHRDIKPENIFLSDGHLVLGDFGIVHFEDRKQTRPSETYENVGSRATGCQAGRWVNG